MAKFCTNCGKEINEGADFCLNCGVAIKKNVEIKKENSSLSKVICAIVSILNPLVGAILYYVFKKSNPELAKISNTCSLISFTLFVVFYTIYLVVVMI